MDDEEILPVVIDLRENAIWGAYWKQASEESLRYWFSRWQWEREQWLDGGPFGGASG